MRRAIYHVIESTHNFAMFPDSLLQLDHCDYFTLSHDLTESH